jgi:hypothetical protein
MTVEEFLQKTIPELASYNEACEQANLQVKPDWSDEYWTTVGEHMGVSADQALDTWEKAQILYGAASCWLEDEETLNFELEAIKAKWGDDLAGEFVKLAPGIYAALDDRNKKEESTLYKRLLLSKLSGALAEFKKRVGHFPTQDEAIADPTCGALYRELAARRE